MRHMKKRDGSQGRELVNSGSMVCPKEGSRVSAEFGELQTVECGGGPYNYKQRENKSTPAHFLRSGQHGYAGRANMA